MKKFRVMMLLAVAALSGCAAMTPAETQVTVKTLVDQIQVATDRISKETAGTSLPPLKQAELTISSKAQLERNGEVGLILSAKGGKTLTDENSMTLVLTPNANSDKTWARGPGQDIADSVIAAVAGLKGSSGLTLTSLSVTASLVVVKTVTGGLEVKLSGVSIGGKSEKVMTSGHSLKLIFEKKAEKKKG